MNMSEFTAEQKTEIKAIMHEALAEFFSAKGKLTKSVLVTAATVIGSLVVIGGGLKWFLGLIGFHYLAK
jgi:uncharacterized membrane protein